MVLHPGYWSWGPESDVVFRKFDLVKSTGSWSWRLVWPTGRQGTEDPAEGQGFEVSCCN